jgi:DNA (cytosine-5)-methyltransferase 1
VSVLAGVDLDPDCKFPFETNNLTKFIHKDVADLQPDDLQTLFPPTGYRVLAGCTPCQPFSRYARCSRSKEYHKWELLDHFLRLVVSLRPAVVTMENVPELQRDVAFAKFVDGLRECEYEVCYSNVFCPDYGIPQNRTRLVLFASLHGAIELEKPTCSPEKHVTVREAISHLPSLKAGRVHAADTLHRSSRLMPINLQRIRKSKPGGCWRDWPSSLVSKCHKAKSGKTYPGVYGRMDWDSPSPTITTQFFGYGNGRFGHPRQNRALSLREGAILQSFPDIYAFSPSPNMSFVKLGRMIGNAVPVRLGEVIGNAIIRHLEGIKP